MTAGLLRDGTLDPADWDEIRSMGHAMVDDMVAYMSGVRERPAWQSPTAASRAELDAPLPRAGRPLGDVYEEFKRSILPFPTGNIHPRFWGWVQGGGTAVGMLAELLGGAMNCHVSGFDQSAAVVERRVIEWMRELMGFPEGTSGLLASGGTVANMIGVAAARTRALGEDVRAAGVGGRGAVVYASTETHSWLKRSCDLLGLGSDSIRWIAVDDEHRVDVRAMDEQIAADRAAGLTPVCVIGTAGTVACGATDDLVALGDVSRRHGVWFHVDGAFGAMARLSPRYRSIVEGLERADSVAFDLHKWGSMQYEQGVVLVRDGSAQSAAFSMTPSYLEKFEGGMAGDPTEFASRGVQLSRGFRALKVWMQLSVYGTDAIGASIERNIDQVAGLRARIVAAPELEQIGPSALNVVCFRAVPEGVADADLDAFNKALLVRVQESGVAVPSNARVGGRFALRVAHVNHRTQPEDFDLLLSCIQDEARRLTSGDFRKF